MRTLRLEKPTCSNQLSPAKTTCFISFRALFFFSLSFSLLNAAAFVQKTVDRTCLPHPSLPTRRRRRRRRRRAVALVLLRSSRRRFVETELSSLCRETERGEERGSEPDQRSSTAAATTTTTTRLLLPPLARTNIISTGLCSSSSSATG